MAFANFTVPEKEEGFADVKYEWHKKAQSASFLKEWITNMKLTTRVEELLPGEWFAKQLDNPDYVQDVYPFDDIGAVGFELWTVNKGSVFDNILVCDSFEYAKKQGEALKKIFDKEKDAKKAWEKATGKDKKR